VVFDKETMGEPYESTWKEEVERVKDQNL